MPAPASLTLGALPARGGRCRFRVWAPRAERVEVHLLGPRERLVPLAPVPQPEGPGGDWAAEVEDVPAGTRYRIRLGGAAEWPDPASRWQPEGVGGPSAVVDPAAFPWTDAGWRGLPIEEWVLYELHVGTFTHGGTFDAILPRLDELRALGVTAIELMPVAQFPGRRNWGYDGVFWFAPQNTYGGPDGLRRLVDACHARGLAVVLDVVYNHLGPEGNILPAFGPYFTERYRTPWGPAMNFDGPDSDGVRRHVVENALAWIEDYHVDGLRLDALHAILDLSAVHILEELSAAVAARAAALGRTIVLVGESDLNDPRLCLPRDRGGYGLDAQWNDDFHHALHALCTGESAWIYADFGRTADLAKAFREGYVYDGRYSRFRRRRHGRPATELEGRRFVVFSQNHDQAGNRPGGDRLASLVGLEGAKLAAAAVLLAPYVPLLFMGEEYAETAPFLYFVDHSDPQLREAVRRGRARELAEAGWPGVPADPAAEETFARSRLRWERASSPEGRAIRAFYAECLRLRRTRPALRALDREATDVYADARGPTLAVVRRGAEPWVAGVFHFGSAPRDAEVPLPAGLWRVILDTAEVRWAGPGARAPREIRSGGVARLPLPGRAAVWLERTGG